MEDVPRGTAPQAASEIVRLTVSSEHDGQRLDHVLTAHIGNRTRSQIQRLIKLGMARVNALPASASTIVREGALVTLEIPPPGPASPTAQALPITIIYDDPDIVIVDKPPGMVVHPAAGHADGTLVNALLHHVQDLSGVGGERRPGIVHRLDRGTSGLMVVAKNDLAHSNLAQQFRDRVVEKHYVALVWGTVQAGRRIDFPVGRDPVNRKKISTRSRRAREAVTRIVASEHFDGVSLIRVAIATGRTHQIRVHLNAIRHPVVGDAIYGGVHRHPPPHLRSVLRLDRPFLHAEHLSFRHPVDGRTLTFESDIPEDLRRVLQEVKAGWRARRAEDARH